VPSSKHERSLLGLYQRRSWKLPAASVPRHGSITNLLAVKMFGITTCMCFRGSRVMISILASGGCNKSPRELLRPCVSGKPLTEGAGSLGPSVRITSLVRLINHSRIAWRTSTLSPTQRAAYSRPKTSACFVAYYLHVGLQRIGFTNVVFRRDVVPIENSRVRWPEIAIATPSRTPALDLTIPRPFAARRRIFLDG
jgi:hypothetical protein